MNFICGIAARNTNRTWKLLLKVLERKINGKKKEIAEITLIYYMNGDIDIGTDDISGRGRVTQRCNRCGV